VVDIKKCLNYTITKQNFEGISELKYICVCICVVTYMDFSELHEHLLHKKIFLGYCKYFFLLSRLYEI
jgi:hypothetical protein